MTHYFIEAYSSPGERVLDIFSGTGTSPLQACIDGRVGIGNDVSPEAYLLTRAKVDPPSSNHFFDYLIELHRRLVSKQREKFEKGDLYFGDNFLKIKLSLPVYYHRETLSQLVRLRSLILSDMKSTSMPRSRNARFCAALVLGILHGDRPESLSMPLDRSKSLTANHIRTMQKKYPGKYERRYKDVIQCLALKAEKVYRNAPPRTKGLAYNKDAAEFMLDSVDMVITSPPYYSAHTYPYDNRHRLWFLGHDYRRIQRKMFQTSNTFEYSHYILRCLRNIQTMLKDGGACVLVVGDVEMDSKGEKIMKKTGEIIADQWADSRNTEMEVARIIVDHIPLKSRRYIHVPVQRGSN